MELLLGITIFALVISVLANYQKTLFGITKGLRMFISVLPAIFNILIFVSLLLAIVPESTIIKLLGKDSGIAGVSIAALVGSISMLPAFVVYPLSGILVKSGVGYNIVAIFITTLMMVGVITLPLEAKYFGVRTAIFRNFLSLIGAIAVGLLMGLFL